MTRGPGGGWTPTRRAVLAAVATGSIGSLSGCPLLAETDTDGVNQPDDMHRLSPSVREPANRDVESAVPRELREQYGTVTNVVEEGADHTGRDPVNDVVRSTVGDDTLLYFPKGEYHLSGELRVGEFSSLALVGDRALFRPPDGFTGLLFVLGDTSGASGLHFEGLDFDFTAASTGGRPLHAVVEDGLLVRDVTVRGRQDVDHDCLRVDVAAESGTGRVERVRLPDGSVTGHPNTGIYVGEQSRGELSFVDCTVVGFSDNGLYASQAQGPTHVRAGHYANNGIAGVRVSGASTVEGVRVTCDTDRSDLENMRGIRLREGTGASVVDCVVEMRSVPVSDGAITMAEWLESATVEDTTVRLEADNVPAVTAKPPRQGISGPASVNIEGLTVRGSAANGATVQVLGRSECLLENVCIHQQGRNRDGIEFANSRGNLLRDTVVDVTGDPLVLREASAERREFRTALRSTRC